MQFVTSALKNNWLGVFVTRQCRTVINQVVALQRLKTNNKRYKRGVYQDWNFAKHKASSGVSEIGMGKGDEFGEFNLGSTIVLLFEAPKNFRFNVEVGQKVLYGNSLGSLVEGFDDSELSSDWFYLALFWLDQSCGSCEWCIFIGLIKFEFWTWDCTKNARNWTPHFWNLPAFPTYQYAGGRLSTRPSAPPFYVFLTYHHAISISWKYNERKLPKMSCCNKRNGELGLMWLNSCRSIIQLNIPFWRTRWQIIFTASKLVFLIQISWRLHTVFEANNLKYCKQPLHHL